MVQDNSKNQSGDTQVADDGATETQQGDQDGKSQHKTQWYQLFYELRNFLNETEPSVSWLVGFLGLLGILWIGVVYVDQRIDKVFENKISPYQSLLKGITLSNSREYEKAISPLRNSFQAFIEEGSNDENDDLYPVINYYLEALANTNSPEDYKSNFNEILRLEESNRIIFDGWRYHQIGWYYFRVGDLEKAEESFNQAIQNYTLKGYYASSSDSFWALALVHLSKGELEEAVSNYEEARTRSYYYNSKSMITELQNAERSSWYRRLIDLYPIEESIPSFISELNKDEYF